MNLRYERIISLLGGRISLNLQPHCILHSAPRRWEIDTGLTFLLHSAESVPDFGKYLPSNVKYRRTISHEKAGQSRAKAI